jgi:hypothetical protein
MMNALKEPPYSMTKPETATKGEDTSPRSRSAHTVAVSGPPKRYGIFGLGLESAIHLPELPAAGQGATDLHFILTEPTTTNELGWLHRWYAADGTQTLACAHEGDGYRLRFPEWADFVLDGTCAHIRALPQHDTPPAVLRHLLLDQVVPRALAHQGHIILHASAVRLPEGCVCLAGPSAAGKSTLAAALCHAGGELLADDSVLLRPGHQGVELVPSYPGLRLWTDSLAAVGPSDTFSQPMRPDDMAKRRLIPTHPTTTRQDSGCPLTAVFLLSLSAEPRATNIVVRLVHGAEGIAALMRQTFVLDVHDRPFAARHLAALADVANTGLPVYRLSYPRHFAQLQAVCEAITRTLAVHP